MSPESMRARQLAVGGAFEFSPPVYPDARGFFVSPLQHAVFLEAVGHPLFPVLQTSYSRSRRGVVRGLHYTATPPGCAKYVYCLRGKVLDVVLDVRVGSPTFGRWDSVVLDQVHARSVYFPVGVAHMFVVLEEDTVMSYLLSEEYVAANELALSPLDPTLGLPVPLGIEPLLSGRDRVAPSLAEAGAAGFLPRYEECLALEARIGRVPLDH